MMSRTFRRLLGALFSVAALAAHAGGPIGACSDGTPMKLAGTGYLQLNLDQGNLGSRTNAQMATLVDRATVLWTGVPWATVFVTPGPSLPVDVTVANYSTYVGNYDDGLNPIIYDTDGSVIDALYGVGQSNNFLAFWGAALKTTPPCEIREAFMVLNGKATMTDTQLTNVIATDIGHFIGLDSTQLDSAQGLPTANYPLMYPLPYRDTVTLHQDDVAAVTALYPHASAASEYGTLTGTFVTAGGAPILGANIWAQNLDTRVVFSAVSDYLGRRTGEFRFLLPRGTYTLHAEAIRTGFHVGPWANGATDASFQPPLYTGGVPMTPVTMSPQMGVLPGCTASVTFAIDGNGTTGATCNAPSEITTPTPGSTLTGTNVVFWWDSGVGVIAARYLTVGTTVGGSQIYSGYQDLWVLSREVAGLPTDGSPVYLRLSSYVDGMWQSRDYSYVSNAIGIPSIITSPAYGTRLPGASVTFQWTAGSLVTARRLSIGSFFGGGDYYDADQGTALSRTVTNLPTDGRTIYARLTSVAKGISYFLDYSYTAALLPAPSIITSPAPGSTLGGSLVSFTWSPGVGVTERYFAVGSTVGGSDIYAGYQGSATARDVTMPTDGRTIYVTLSSWVNGAWSTSNYVYTAFNNAPPPPAKSNLTSPAAGSTFTGTSATFQWSAGSGVTERYLSVGSSAGASDIYGGYQGAALSRTVSTLPTDGRTIYVSLSSWVGGGWLVSSATYTASGIASGPPPVAPSKSILTSPAPGSTLAGMSVTFQWDAGSSVTERYLAIGSTAGASDIYGGYQGSALSKIVTTLPTDGRTVYVSLSSWVDGGWQASSATYTAASGGPPPPDLASIVTQPVGSFTSGAPSETFGWTPGTGVTERYLMVGTTSGGSQIYAGYQGPALSRVVPAMPAPGTRIYVRLMSYVDGSWLVRDREYTVGP